MLRASTGCPTSERAPTSPRTCSGIAPRWRTTRQDSTASQAIGNAVCENFDQSGEWGWARGRFGQLTRSVVAGPQYLVDIVELNGPTDHTLELPWHLAGEVEITPSGTWVPAELTDEFAHDVERFVPAEETGRVLRSRSGAATLNIHLPPVGELLRAVAPGAPGTSASVPFYIVRAEGKNP